MDPINEAYQKDINEAKSVDAYEFIQGQLYDMWNLMRSIRGQVLNAADAEKDADKKAALKEAAHYLSGNLNYRLQELQSDREMSTYKALKGLKIQVK